MRQALGVPFVRLPSSSAAPPTAKEDKSQACKGQPVIEVPKACHNCHLPLNKKTP